MKAVTKRKIRFLIGILFSIYLVLLLYLVFFSEDCGRQNWLKSDYRYNIELFKEIRRFWVHKEQLGAEAVLLNLLGNIIGFLPLGFMMPIFIGEVQSMWKMGMIGLFASMIVEGFQLIGKVGCFDVDDLLLNTIGTVAGYLIFVICNKIRRYISEKTL